MANVGSVASVRTPWRSMVNQLGTNRKNPKGAKSPAGSKSDQKAWRLQNPGAGFAFAMWLTCERGLTARPLGSVEGEVGGESNATTRAWPSRHP